MRVLRLVRLAKLKRIFFKIEDYIASTTLANLMQFLRLLFLIFLLAHWTACLWYYVSVNEELKSPETWVGFVLSGTQHSTFEVYATALYFTFATMSTVGFGDVHPYSRNEKIFAILTMVLACGVFAYTVGSISSLLTKSTLQESEHRARVISVNRYMRKQCISVTTQFRVRRYLEYLWDNQKSNALKEKEILALLSGPLRDEVYSHVHGAVILLCPIFEEVETVFLSKLSKLLEGETFAPGDVIFQQGERTSKMYFIQTGNVNIYHKDTRSNFITLPPGNYFGEIAFFLDIPRTASTSCVDFVDLFSLSRRDLKFVAESLPISKDKLDAILSKCSSGDLSSLCVHCYICSSLGHVAGRCSRALINYDHEVSKSKWLRTREKQTVLVNPNMDMQPNVQRYARPKLRVAYQARNVRGYPRSSETLFESEPELLKVVREFQESAQWEATVASRQPSYRPTESNAEEPAPPRRPRFSIITNNEEAEAEMREFRRGVSFRRSLMRRVPPIIEIEAYERTKTDNPGVSKNTVKRKEVVLRFKAEDEESEVSSSDFRPFLSFGDSDDISTTVKETTPGLVWRR